MEKERLRKKNLNKKKAASTPFEKFITIVTTLRRILVFASIVKKLIGFGKVCKSVSAVLSTLRFRMTMAMAMTGALIMRDSDVTTIHYDCSNDCIQLMVWQQLRHSTTTNNGDETKWSPFAHSHTNLPNQKHQTYKEKFVLFHVRRP